MKREFIYTAIFDRMWKELGLADDDLQELENFIMGKSQSRRCYPRRRRAYKIKMDIEKRRQKRRNKDFIY